MNIYIIYFIHIENIETMRPSFYRCMLTLHAYRDKACENNNKNTKRAKLIDFKERTQENNNIKRITETNAKSTSKQQPTWKLTNKQTNSKQNKQSKQHTEQKTKKSKTKPHLKYPLNAHRNACMQACVCVRARLIYNSCLTSQ